MAGILLSYCGRGGVESTPPPWYLRRYLTYKVVLYMFLVQLFKPYPMEKVSNLLHHHKGDQMDFEKVRNMDFTRKNVLLGVHDVVENFF